jgi:hypothetical protein
MIINNDDAQNVTQANWQDALTDAHCPTCLQRIHWTSPRTLPNSGSSPRVSLGLVGTCCGVSYTLTSVDQPASDHSQLFGVIQRMT